MKYRIQNLNKDKYWVDDLIDNKTQVNFVNGILPNTYTHYFKLFLPIGLKSKTGSIRQITYKELAEMSELVFNKSFSITNLIKKYGGLPSDLAPLKTMDEKFVMTLAEILGEEEEVIFEGFGDDVVPEEFERPWTIECKLAYFRNIIKQLNSDNYLDFNHFPNLVYPKNKTWCIAEIIFQSGILLMGCNSTIAEKIRNQRTIDFDEILYSEQYFEFISH